MAKGLKGKAICSVKDCERHVHSWSMCDKHAKRARRLKDPAFRKHESEVRLRWFNANKERHRKNQRLWRAAHIKKLKDLCYAAYGGYICSCLGCGVVEPLFLTLDHIKGGGNRHRLIIGIRGGQIYRWIVKHNFPVGMFRVLCSNCNTGRARNGGICPHMEESNVT